MAPQYIPLSHSYSTAPSNNLVAHHQHAEQLQPQHNPFAFTSYSSSGGPNGIVPVFGNNNYIRPRPQQATLMPNIPQDSFVHSPRNVQQSYVQDHHYSHHGHHSQSPPNLKYEPPLHSAQSSANTSPSQVSRPIREITNTIATNGSNEEFGTEVDTLMKAIQAKEQSTKSQSALERSRPVVSASSSGGGCTVSPSFGHTSINEEIKLTYKNSQVAVSHDKGTKKRYQCKIGKCTKSFYQKTHLEIHERAHTGVKPYVCTYPGCDRTFSQHGNLRTHLRRHTGERPYQCDQCGRLFAQKGNVRAHKVTHSNEKPFVCHLDDCGKEFTQRGNLKSHQNKFHAPTIKKLTTKFSNYQAGDTVTPADKALWEYFADLYKNSNKGIKGRGKDRKIDRKACSTTEVMNTSMRNLNVTPISKYGPGTMRQYNDIGYEIDDSGSHSGSSSNSSQGSCYDDAPSDGYEDFGRMH